MLRFSCVVLAAAAGFAVIKSYTGDSGWAFVGVLPCGALVAASVYTVLLAATGAERMRPPPDG